MKETSEYSFGSIVSSLDKRQWNILIDLYQCRCIRKTAVINIYFLGNPNFDTVSNVVSTVDDKAKKSAETKARRILTKLKNSSLIEYSSIDPEEAAKSPKLRKHIKSETWYYLTNKGLKLVELKIGVLEESRLSKHELDLERAKKEHFWELARIYLDLRYKWTPDLKQFDEWDWHPSLTVYSSNQVMSVRPDAVLRVGEQVFYIELDRATEPVQRSPFVTEQVSIQSKLARYRDVLKNAQTEIQAKGIIAFIFPDAAERSTRLENIKKVAEDVFTGANKIRLYTGRNIGDIIMTYYEELESVEAEHN